MFNDYYDLLGDVKEQRNTANQSLKLHVPNSNIDEVGVKFNHVEEADEFLAWAKLERGLEHFNHSDERLVLRREGQSESDPFGLRLDFLRYPADRSWRIEVMVPDGDAPLHDPVPGMTPIHTAFKVAWDHYPGVVSTLMGRGMNLLGMCDNDYGMFAYFGDEAGDAPYLKPRSPRPVITADAEDGGI